MLIDVPNMGLPVAVDPVAPAMIQDQQILNVTESLRTVASAISVGDDQFGDRFVLRGLEVHNRDFTKTPTRSAILATRSGTSRCCQTDGVRWCSLGSRRLAVTFACSMV
jgi:hypothetical protein